MTITDQQISMNLCAVFLFLFKNLKFVKTLKVLDWKRIENLRMEEITLSITKF